MKHTINSINERKPLDSRLTVVDIFIQGQRTKCNCTCSCGTSCIVDAAKIINGHTKSCGCLSKETSSLLFSKYSIKNRPLYTCYKAMIDRCYNNKNKRYKNYGAVGVSVCDEWLKSFEVFAEWALSNGYKRGLQLDKDILGDSLLYSPNTCQFVTPQVNANNRKNCRFYLHDGIKKSLMAICKDEGIKYEAVRHYLRHFNKTIDEAIFLVKSKSA